MFIQKMLKPVQPVNYWINLTWSILIRYYTCALVIYVLILSIDEYNTRIYSVPAGFVTLYLYTKSLLCLDNCIWNVFIFCPFSYLFYKNVNVQIPIRNTVITRHSLQKNRNLAINSFLLFLTYNPYQNPRGQSTYTSQMQF